MKLVRDRIPEIILKEGKMCDYIQLEPERHYSFLMAKLVEEVSEFQEAKSDEEWLEELADVQEVILALLAAKGHTFPTLELKREEKKALRGGFEKGYCLTFVETEQNDTCVFCDLSQKTPVLESEHCFAVYDLNPVSPGHMLIIPKNHYAQWFETPQHVQNNILKTLPLVRAHLNQEFQPDGYNVGFNCGSDAGQTVFHLHVHVIPRYQGDVEDPTGGVRGVIPSKQKY